MCQSDRQDSGPEEPIEGRFFCLSWTCSARYHPEKIALSIALGAVFGIFPVLGSTREMNKSEVAIHRLRKRYPELFRQEIADTVADPAEVESELGYLAVVLTRK
jgi:hypothetical protein